jgi:tetratricopeptide (TPR) repeat protein
MPVIASGSEYTDNLNKAEELSKDALGKFENGETLTDVDKKKLNEAMVLFKALVAFQPEGFGPYFGLAKIHQALGEPQPALFYMKRFIEFSPPSPIPEIKRLLAEAHYTCGKIYEDMGEFEEANNEAITAIKHFRENPNYLSFLASAKLRANKTEEAHKLVDEALKLDPNNGRAKELHRMMGKH